MAGFIDNKPDIVRGPLYAKGYDSDGSLWLPAVGGVGGFQYFVGTFTATRAAAGDYYEALTAAANSPFVVVDLSQIFDKVGSDPLLSLLPFPGSVNASAYPMPAGMSPGTMSTDPPQPYKVGSMTQSSDLHLIRGLQLVGYDVVFSVATAALTTHTGTVYETQYDLTHAAGTVVTKDAAQALGVATGTNVQMSNTKLATPFVLGSNASVQNSVCKADYLEIAIVNPGTSVYHLYGVRLYFNYCLH